MIAAHLAWLKAAPSGLRRRRAAVALALLFLLLQPAQSDAYIGPGAGFALVSSFFGILAAALLALLSLVRWPFRVLWRLVRRTPRRAGRIRRLIIIGFDGQSPALTEAWMAAGRLPNFAALAARGCYHRLRSTTPPVSPVAWSTFATGVNPGRHGIFDFIDRDPRTYRPRISSTRIDPPSRSLRVGSWRLPLGRTRLRLLRGSEPFWSLLGRAGVWSTILRVPVTFPPDRFHGAQLSAMAAPDLLGTQGTYFLLTTREAPHPNPLPASGERGKSEGADGAGVRIPLVFEGDLAAATIKGPPNPWRADGRPLSLPVTVRRARDGRSVTVRLGRRTVRLELGVLTEWTPLAFPVAAFVRAHGLCRFQLTELGDHVSIYASPISLDPERPVMPISHPPFYAPYLAKKIGAFSTLGLAEDTSALNDGAIDETTFLQQARDIDGERQRMFVAALDRLREGALACVFDATDRVQHMGWRELDASHPASRGRSPATPSAIEAQYRRNDAFLGEIVNRLGDGDLLMVLSDHGFTAFRRGVNLNRWLLDRGYLALKAGADPSAEWLAAVDWSRTRAYAVGLTGIFLNVFGREGHGVVDRREAAALRTEIAGALAGLHDDERNARAVRSVRDAADAWDGPYIDRAPDLIVGFDEGYRVSWACASGAVAGPLFEDNARAWSGDHCVDTDVVPGVFFCSQPIARADPALIDIAPTALTLFGVDVPRHVQGRPLFNPVSDK